MNAIRKAAKNISIYEAQYAKETVRNKDWLSDNPNIVAGVIAVLTFVRPLLAPWPAIKIGVEAFIVFLTQYINKTTL